MINSALPSSGFSIPFKQDLVLKVALPMKLTEILTVAWGAKEPKMITIEAKYQRLGLNGYSYCYWCRGFHRF
jgi:hypothetical protein